MTNLYIDFKLKQNLFKSVSKFRQNILLEFVTKIAVWGLWCYRRFIRAIFSLMGWNAILMSSSSLPAYNMHIKHFRRARGCGVEGE